MPFLESIHDAKDVRSIPASELPHLAEELRQRLIEVVSKTGGHIGAGLGVVELTITLLHSFDSPVDKILWDVGHQGYPWKLLTGRNDRFPTLRQAEGLSGFLRRTESEHDHFGAGHAGTALSAAFGVATARDLKEESFHVVAVVGDGALTCGLPYEAMNNAGTLRARRHLGGQRQRNVDRPECGRHQQVPGVRDCQPHYQPRARSCQAGD